MPKKLDLAGMKFGKLTAIEHGEPVKIERKLLTWLCRCDCGGSITVVTDRLAATSAYARPITSCDECSARACVECGKPLSVTHGNRKVCVGCAETHDRRKEAAFRANPENKAKLAAIQKERTRKMRESAAKWLAHEAALGGE